MSFYYSYIEYTIVHSKRLYYIFYNIPPLPDKCQVTELKVEHLGAQKKSLKALLEEYNPEKDG